MIPRLSFELSHEVAAIYAIEMSMEAHPVEVKVRYPIQVFDPELLEKCREELSITSFLWHLKPLIAITRDIRDALRIHCENEIVPLLNGMIRAYEAHWKRILPTLEENIKSLAEIWEKYGNTILSEIANISRHPWGIEEIKVYIVEPIVGGHGDAFPDKGIVIFEGIKPSSPESIIGLVHEIAHINTLPPLKGLLETRDIRSKVLYEIVNEYITEQAMVNAKILPTLDDFKLREIFEESVKEWMTESSIRFTYDPVLLKRKVDEWWTEYLRSSKNLLQSFIELEKVTLPIMQINASKPG